MLREILGISIIFIIAVWIFFEYIGYIPTTEKVFTPGFDSLFLSENFKNVTEQFLNKVKLPKLVPVPSNINSSYSKNKSVNKNDVQMLEQNDTILRNIRTRNQSLFSNTRELNFSQMNKLIENILKTQDELTLSNTHKTVKIETDEDVPFVLFHFICLVNKTFLHSKFVYSNTTFVPYTIISYKIFFIRKYQNDEKEYNLNIQIGRPNKIQTFTFNVTIILITKFNINIKLLEIVGMPIMHNNNDTNGLKSNQPDTQKDYKCFNPNAPDGEIPFNNEIFCTSYHKQLNSIGVWDKPCSSSDECPYYLSNKNYTNNFGGCLINGKCEMPIGVSSIGYRNIGKGSTPLCYNCPSRSRGNHNCCEEQKENESLNSPDYMFPNDLEIRTLFQDQLESKNLLVSHTI